MQAKCGLSAGNVHCYDWQRRHVVLVSQISRHCRPMRSLSFVCVCESAAFTRKAALCIDRSVLEAVLVSQWRRMPLIMQTATTWRSIRPHEDRTPTISPWTRVAEADVAMATTCMHVHPPELNPIIVFLYSDSHILAANRPLRMLNHSLQWDKWVLNRH